MVTLDRRSGRRDALKTLAAGAAWLGLGGAAVAQQYAAPRIGRYKVWRVTFNNRSWIRDLVIESASSYAMYEFNNGPLYGRGTYSFDGTSARYLTGPFYELGYRGSSYVRPDGKHYLRLGNSVEAISDN